MGQRLNGMLLTMYLITLLCFGLVLLSAVTGAPIVRQAEAEFGRALTCNEAYSYRAIDAYFYPDHSFQGNLIYTFALFSPFLLPLFSVLVAVIAFKRRLQTGVTQPTPAHVALASIGLLMLVAVLTYMPVISTIACATE